VIEVVAVSKTFDGPTGSSEVLHDVSVSVARGQIAAVSGPSGAGKTTLARCINALERPTTGRVVVDGQDLTDLSERQLSVTRRRIGTIFQASSLLTRRTAARNVALPLEMAGVDRRERDRRVAELLERVGLGDRGGAHPRELSGGQRQRVGIARALATAPHILLSDEATSGLDPEATRSILALLRELRDDLGLTILLITHEMDVVRAIADHATLLRAGRVVETGAVSDLLHDPASALGRGLLPPPAAAFAADGLVLHLTYARADVAPDWIGRLERETGARVGLLGATVEAIGEHPAGRVTIAVAGGPSEPELTALLTVSGLHVDRVEHGRPSAIAEVA
jgi:ABC-type methionine transport system ATPase subunit